MLRFQLGYAQKTVLTVADNPTLKFLVGVLTALFDVQPGLIVAVFIAMFFDGVTGVWHSVKKGDKIRQTIVASAVTKAIVYTIGIAVSLAVSNSGVEFFSLLDDIVIGAILFTECVSISGHLAFLHSGWRNVFTMIRLISRKGNVPTFEDAAAELKQLEENSHLPTVPPHDQNTSS